jgi:type IV secretory pathway VirB4 component
MALGQQANPTQEFVPIKEVRDGIVILKDGSLRAVLMTSSMNFALKSEDEQTSILFQFQNFLNSLDFSVQIFIQSRPLDIRPYISLLEERYKAQTSDLMRIQIREYIEFVRNFVEGSNIMSKSFFCVVPYSPSVLQTKGGTGIFPIASKKKSDTAQDRNADFEENRTQLEQRISVVEQGLLRSGIRSVQLGTEEVIELFYKMFNPGELEKPISLNQ